MIVDYLTRKVYNKPVKVMIDIPSFVKIIIIMRTYYYNIPKCYHILSLDFYIKSFILTVLFFKYQAKTFLIFSYINR